jgi:uracil-DNA glycosylase family 4
MTGFFTITPASPPPSAGALLAQCGACGLYKKCDSPKMPVTGEGRKGILIVAEAPGEEEDKRGTQLVGKAGQLLRRCLEEYCDISLDRDCWKTNALICHPAGNRTPTNDEIDYCRPNLRNTIKALRPRVIMPLGNAAVRSLIGPLWREDPGGIGLWAGWRIPMQRWNAWVCPTWHPSYLDYCAKDRNYPALRGWWRRHLEGMAKLEGRPYPDTGPPRYDEQIQIIYDPGDAARVLREWIADGGMVCHDFETNRLQPYYDDAEIVSCAVCWRGQKTIAFPWVGEAITAMRELLVSGNPKVGANTKFEDTWGHERLGVWTNNWVKDVMQDAHILDNRKGITSVKFQAFVRLGLEPWNLMIKPYLEDSGPDGRNRIHELVKSDLRSLLWYNAIDAAAEFDIALHQWEEWKNAN